MSEANQQQSGGWGCLLILVIGGGFIGAAVYKVHQKEQDEERAVLRAANVATQSIRDLLSGKRTGILADASDQQSFWPPGEARFSSEGFMISDKYIPLRAIARRPNASMFGSENLRYPQDVVGVMKPWQPYYVFKRLKVKDRDDSTAERRAMLIGVSSQTPERERKWVDEKDCFCWTTRKCINIKTPVSIYASREELENGGEPRDTGYSFQYSDHFESGRTGNASQQFRMSSLPVLRREDGEYWCFVRPEGTEQGYQVCWIKWDGDDPKAECRIRTSRFEFEEYLAGVRSLMIDYRSPEKQAESKLKLSENALRNLEQVTDPIRQAMTANDVRNQKQGIPKLSGFLAEPIQNPLQYDKMSENVIKLINLSERDIWDINEIAYIPTSDLP